MDDLMLILVYVMYMYCDCMHALLLSMLSLLHISVNKTPNMSSYDFIVLLHINAFSYM